MIFNLTIGMLNKYSLLIDPFLKANTRSLRFNRHLIAITLKKGFQFDLIRLIDLTNRQL